MASTYSSNLKIELMATGENSGTWGTITNTNMGTAVEEAIVGYGNPDYLSDANLTLTISNSNATQTARALVLNVTSGLSLTATRELVVPTAQKPYVVQNNTTGSQSILVKTTAGTGITVPNGFSAYLYTDGTNVVQMANFMPVVRFNSLLGNGGTSVTAILDEDSMASDSATALATQQSIKAYVDAQVGSFDTLAEVLAQGNTTGGTDLAVSAGDDITFTATSNAIFADNGKAIFGAGSDLQIYHDGTTSKIDGNLSVTNALTLSAGTANGVTYLNGSKVLTSGSALTFDGTTFGVNNGVAGGAALSLTGTYTGAGSVAFLNFQRVGGAVAGTLGYNDANNSIQFGTTTNHSTIFLQNNAEAMRLTSTGLGIGTSSPISKLTVLGAGTINAPETTTTGGSIQTASYGITTRTGNLELGATDALAANIGGSLSFSARYSGTNATWVTGKIGAYRDTATSGVASSYLAFATTTGAGDLTERLRLDSVGNLGLGVTPSAWRSGDKAIQVGSVASLNTDTDVTTDVGYNYFYNSSDVAIYSTTAQASRYSQYLGAHRFFTAPSGTAGNAISFTQAMTLDASGRLGIGTSSPQHKIDAIGNIRSANSTNTAGQSANIFAATFNSNFGQTDSATFQSVLNNATTGENDLFIKQFNHNSGSTDDIVLKAASGNSGYTALYTADTERMRIDSAGNVGLSVTPSAWYTADGVTRALQISVTGALTANNDAMRVMNNAFFNTSGVATYISNGYAEQYLQNGGQHAWYTAPSGTAGNTISFTQAMTLTADGNLGVGTTGISSRLHVVTTAPSITVMGSTAANGGYLTFNNGSTDPLYIGFGSTLATGLSTSDAALRYSNNLVFSSGSAEKMRIDSSGNVGIGVSSPDQPLAFADSIGVKMQLNGSNANGYQIAMASSVAGGDAMMKFTAGETGAGEIGWYNTTNLRMLLTAGGDLLVGTTSAGISNTNGLTIEGASGFQTINHGNGSPSGKLYIQFGYYAGAIGSITQSGTTAVLYNTTSDQRLKENIVDADSASVLIDSLQVRQFDWKSENSHQRYGFVAQELVNVAPEAVHQPADPEEMMAVDYSKLVPMLVKEIQSLRQRLAAAGI
jgi:hypothetical protein